MLRYYCPGCDQWIGPDGPINGSHLCPECQEKGIDLNLNKPKE